jgi:hypothetical protein
LGLADPAPTGQDLRALTGAVASAIMAGVVGQDHVITVPAGGQDLVPQTAVQALAAGWRDDPNTLPWLRQRATTDQHWTVRQAAVQALAAGWRDDPSGKPAAR